MLTVSFLMPEPTRAAPRPICEIGCVNEQYCTRDRDCPGGHCNFICPYNGCCVYP
jgi:hypothetical protein